MATQNLQIILKNRPTGAFSPSEAFTSKVSPAPNPADLEQGQVLTETLYVSVDPIMRMWLDRDNYLLKIEDESVMVAPALSRVLESRVESVKPGDLVTALSGWTTYAVLDEGSFEKFTPPAGAKITDALGFLGFTGLTAYFAMLRVGKPKAGETVVVSAAAGAVGSVAAQLAKMQGARVVGIAGSSEKCAWLEELGVDVAVNYKEEGFEERFVEVVGGGIDVYFDNVGGRILELAIQNMKERGRIVIVGDVSGYNTSKPYGIKSLFPLAPKAATLHGFNIFHHLADAAAAREELARWLQEGKLKRTETVIKGGLEAAPEALAKLLEGGNTGKMLVEVKAIE